MSGRRSLAALLAAAVLPAGCGGSKDASGLGHEDLIARADVICAHARSQAHLVELQVTRAELRAGERPGLRSFVTMERQLAPIERAQVRELAGLAPPRKDRATYRRFVMASRAAVTATGNLVAAAARGDMAQSRSIDARLGPSTRLQRAAARGLGFRVCGTPLLRPERG